MAKFLGVELMNSKGKQLIIPLTKCLDSDAYCEIIVEDITKKNGDSII
jgi:hypothetical protein